MILVDTSVWIEFLRGRSPFFQALSVLLEDRRVLALECVFAELMQGAKDASERRIVSEYWSSLPQYTKPRLMLEAGVESSTHGWANRGIGLIDGMILLAARDSIAQIWTLDKKLQSLLKRSEIYA